MDYQGVTGRTEWNYVGSTLPVHSMYSEKGVVHLPNLSELEIADIY